MTATTGAIIGAYQLDTVIGSGGMGSVWRAIHRESGRAVALKLMHPHLASLPGFNERFVREARALAALRHPHIVDMHEIGEHEGGFFIAMELVEGGSLRGLLQRRTQNENAWPLSLGVELVRQAADALGHAHAAGIIHRDVKPDNMLLGRAEDDTGFAYCLKVSDFGLVQIAEEQSLTTGGMTLGTPAYLSPDQCQGNDASGRSDIYSLGVVLYEVATGYLPFDVRTLSEAIFKHVFVPPPPPRQIRPSIPPELEALILRCMAKQPEQRYASASEVAAGLREIVPALVRAEAPAETVGGLFAVQGFDPVPTPVVLVLSETGEMLASAPLGGEGLSIGRAADNDIALDLEGLAPYQLLVDWDGAEVRVMQVATETGAWLGAERLALEMPRGWKPGTPVRCATVELQLLSPDLGPATGPSEYDQWPSHDYAPVASVVAEQEEQPEGVAAPQLVIVDRIAVVLDGAELVLTPGETSSVRVTLANLGRTVEQLTLAVEGVPTEWVQAAPPLVQLNPGVQATATLHVTAPRTAESKAGEYPVQVLAASRDKPGEAGAAGGNWTVLPFLESQYDLKPRRAAGLRKGKYTLKISNQGNAPARYSYGGEDEEQALTYSFAEPRLTVQPGAAATVVVHAETALRMLGASAMRSFNLNVKQEGVKENQALSAQFVSNALIPGWIIKVLILAIASTLLYGFALVPPPLKSAPRVGFLLAPTKVAPTVAPKPTRAPKPTATPKPTRTPKPTKTPKPTQTLEPTATEVPPTATMTPTITATPMPACVAGVPFPVRITGPAQSAVLLWFDERIVGSGYIGEGGSVTIPLIVGAERSGVYPVKVTLRDTPRVLQEFICQVP